jgi:hypothetical protein
MRSHGSEGVEAARKSEGVKTYDLQVAGFMGMTFAAMDPLR